MTTNIFLIGFMGTGKTTISKQLGKMLEFLEIDMDAEIERREEMKISTIFDTYGEEYFRGLETALLKEFQQKSGHIISCGGGVVLRPENVKVMKASGTVVLLTAEPENIYKRVCHSSNRPLLNGNMNVAYIREMMERRSGYYRAAADVTVVTDDKEPEKIAEEILEYMENMNKNMQKPKVSFDF